MGRAPLQNREKPPLPGCFSASRERWPFLRGSGRRSSYSSATVTISRSYIIRLWKPFVIYRSCCTGLQVSERMNPFPFLQNSSCNIDVSCPMLILLNFYNAKNKQPILHIFSEYFPPGFESAITGIGRNIFVPSSNELKKSSLNIARTHFSPMRSLPIRPPSVKDRSIYANVWKDWFVDDSHPNM